MKIPWRRAWQPTPVFLPGESHGQRNLGGSSPQGRKQLDATEVTKHTDTHTHTIIISLSISPFRSISIYLMYLDALMLGTYAFKILMLS